MSWNNISAGEAALRVIARAVLNDQVVDGLLMSKPRFDPLIANLLRKLRLCQQALFWKIVSIAEPGARIGLWRSGKAWWSEITSGNCMDILNMPLGGAWLSEVCTI